MQRTEFTPHSYIRVDGRGGRHFKLEIFLVMAIQINILDIHGWKELLLQLTNDENEHNEMEIQIQS